MYHDIPMYASIPVAQTLEHSASNAKVMDSIPRECMIW